MPRHPQRILDDRGDVHSGGRLVLRRTAVGGEFLYYVAGVLGVAYYVVYVGHYELRVRFVPCRISHPQDPRQRVVYLVGYAGGEGAYTRELLRLDELELEHLLLGDVLAYSYRAQDLALLVHHRREGEADVDEPARVGPSDHFPVPY